MLDIETAVLGYLSELQADPPIRRDTELMDAGLLDSIGLVRLIQFLEAEFKISISDAEIAPQIFASPATITAFVQSKRV